MDPNHAHHGHSSGGPATAEHPHQPQLMAIAVPTGSLSCCECRDRVEAQLRSNPHVLGVHLDAGHQVAHVQVHAGMVTPEELAELAACACGDRNPVPLP